MIPRTKSQRPVLLAVVKAANPLKAFCLVVFTDNSVQNSMVCLCAWQIHSVFISLALKIPKNYEEKCSLGHYFSKLERELRPEKEKKNGMSSYKSGSTDSAPALLNQLELG